MNLRCLSFLVSVGLLVCFASESRADLVDQFYTGTPDNDFLPGTTSNPTSQSGRLGQEFTPTLDGIDWVEFHFRHVAGGATAELMTVNLRLGDSTNHDLDGTILGSATTTIPAGIFDSIVRLNFSANIALTPGTLYAFEVQGSTAFNTLIRADTGAATYTGGVGIVSNAQSLGTDFIFREGENDPAAVPEPASLLLTGLTAFATAGYGWRRSRRNPVTPRT